MPLEAAGLEALAARCEQEKPTQKLCEDIAVAIGWKVLPDIHRWKTPTGKYEYSVPLFAYSLDAAVTLVPAECGVELSRYWLSEPAGPMWSAYLYWGIAGASAEVADVRSAALALCAAALRARAAQLQLGTPNDASC